MDYSPGHNVNSHPFQTESAEGCWKICQSFPGAKGFSWFKSQSPRHAKGCYCKKNIGVKEPNKFIISGPSECTGNKQTLYICWFVSCRVPRKYTNSMQGTKWSSQRGLYGEPFTIPEVEKHFCTRPSWLDHFVPCIGFLYWVVWQNNSYFFCQGTFCTLLSGSNFWK